MFRMKTFIVLVLFHLINICQSVPDFLEEDRSFDRDDPTEPSNTVKELLNIYYFWKDLHFIYVPLNTTSITEQANNSLGYFGTQIT